MTLNLPLFSLGMIQIFTVLKTQFMSRSRTIFVLTTSFLLLFGYTFYKMYLPQYLKDQDDTLFIKNSIEITDRIPVDQRSSIFTYNVHSKYWLIAHLIPNYKFFTLQEWHGEHDNTILIEMSRMIEVNPPLWIIIPNEETIKKSLNPEFFDLLVNDYQENYRNEALILFNRK